MTLDWLAQRTATTPQKTALIHGARCWTYAELNRLVDQTTGRLIAAGVAPGDHVAVLMPNRVEYVCLIHALARLGAVLTPLNTRLTVDELRWQVQQARCSLLICSQETEERAAVLDSRCPVLSVDGPDWRPAAEAGQRCSHRPLHLEAVQGVLFTSGTTGRPKGAMLTYANHLWSAVASAMRLGSHPEDRWLLCLPLYHVGGQAIVLRCCLYGAAVVLHAGFDPAAVAQALAAQGITLVSLAPTMLYRLLEMGRRALAQATALRCILLGGATASPTLLARCHSLGLPVAPTYGLTETASQVATATPATGRRKPGSVGRPLTFSQVRIEGEDGEEQPAGVVGQIVVRGPTVMRGYYGRPQATQAALRGGELYSGDLGYLDEAGDLWVVQRRQDLIVSGGENVYPAEVERVLEEHPDVAEACVVGAASEEWGQRVAALVAPRPGADLSAAALLDFSRRRLAGYKQPRILHFVAALPRTASGKTDREAVRRQVALALSNESARLEREPHKTGTRRV